MSQTRKPDDIIIYDVPKDRHWTLQHFEDLLLDCHVRSLRRPTVVAVDSFTRESLIKGVARLPMNKTVCVSNMKFRRDQDLQIYGVTILTHVERVERYGPELI